MGFNYKRGHGGDNQDSMWTSYSDLFLGLSIIFLLLYVTASLKTGTDGIQQHLENQQLVKQNQDLKQQIKVYETLKQDYLQQQASVEEKDTYAELMDKLELLQDEQKQESDKLRQQAKENEKKAVALNKYQQLVRNIINSNMIQKSRIKSRDTLIDVKDEEIGEKNEEISQLEGTVAQKTAEIAKSEQQLEQTKNQLDQRMKQLRAAFQSQQISKQKFEQQQAALKREADQKVAALQARSEKAQQELNEANRELQETEAKLAQTEGTVQKLGAQNAALAGELASAATKHKADTDRLKGEFEAQKARDKAAFEGQLAKEKLSGAQRAAREAAFKADAERKAKDLAGRLGDLDKKYKDAQGALAKATENLNAKKNLAAQIKKNFAKAGISAEVDPNSGDVMLSFGDQYFDTGSATLKPKMRTILEQAMPAYSASLFENDKVAQKIQSVEIVGFASPTYKGKYVDPTKLDPETKAAVNYNLDLSYARARSIFENVFDKNKMSFRHQERLLPLVKVTGRSFLAADKSRDPAAQGSGEAFCRSNDCAKLQRVIIKFTLKD